MTFEEFTGKLALIQAEEYLSVEDTLSLKRDIVGTKKLWDCTSKELDDIMNQYRKVYKSNKYRQNNVYYKSKYVKSKNKYGHRKDWD